MELIQKLEQFGFQVPQNQGDDSSQRLVQILKQISAQYEQTKDVVWCCLDQPTLANGQKLDATDAFHAITSEIHGLLVHTSQVHKLYQQQLTEQKQVTETLEEQLQQLKQNQQVVQNQNNVKQQVENIKQTYIEEIYNLKQKIGQLNDELTSQNQLNIQLEKENIILKTQQTNTQAVKTKQEMEQYDDIGARRLIFQRDVLEKQIKELTEQKQQYDLQVSQYTSLMQLTQGQLTKQGVDAAVLQQYNAVSQNLANLCTEHDATLLDLNQLKQQNAFLKNLAEKEKLQWIAEKAELKKGWTEIYNQICQQLGIFV